MSNSLNIQPSHSKGIISPVSIPCSCGGHAMYQEWIESLSKLGDYKRYGIIFCQECSKKTRIHSERTPIETKNECIFEWKAINNKTK